MHDKNRRWHEWNCRGTPVTRDIVFINTVFAVATSMGGLETFIASCTVGLLAMYTLAAGAVQRLEEAERCTVSGARPY